MAAPGSDGPSLDAAWEEACVAFSRTAGIDLKTETPPTADAIRAKLDAKKAKDADESRQIEKVRDLFGRTMKCINVVGGIAAQGASMVSGSPASIASSALSFFINAGVQYRRIFSDIDKLLSQVVTIFERFQVYCDNQSVLPSQMISIASKILTAVVQMCGVCYSVLKKNTRIKTLLNITLFGDDSGIQAQLGKLRDLVEEETQMRGTLNLITAERTQRTVDSGFARTNSQLKDLFTGVQKVQDWNLDREDLTFLQEALGVDTKNANVREYQRVAEHLFSESCEWLHYDASYRSWSTVHQASGTLAIAGDEGCGKSCAITAIIQDLVQRNPQRQENADRVSIAYFFVVSPGPGEQPATVQEVVKSWALQIAQNDPFYRRSLNKACRRVPLSGNAVQLWKQLFLDFSDEQATIFIAIDGIQHLTDTDQACLQQLLVQLASLGRTSLCTKVLLGARRNFVRTIAAKLPKLTTLDLAEKSQNDIERFVQEKTSQMTNISRG